MNLPIRNYLCIEPLTMYAVISNTKCNTKVRKYGMDQLVGSGIGFGCQSYPQIRREGSMPLCEI